MYKSLLSRLLRKTGIILKRSISLQPLLTACIDQDGRAANGVVNVLSTLGFREEKNRPSQSDLRLVGGDSVDCWLEKNRLENYWLNKLFD